MQFEVVTTNSRRGASPAKAPPNDPAHANARPQSELIADNANSTSSGHTEPFVAPAQHDLFGDLRRTETAVREPPHMPNNADQRRVVLSLQPLPSGSRAGEEQAQPSADTDGGPRTLSADAGAGALQSRAAGIHGVSAAKPEWADPTSTSVHSPQAFHAPLVDSQHTVHVPTEADQELHRARDRDAGDPALPYLAAAHAPRRASGNGPSPPASTIDPSNSDANGASESSRRYGVVDFERPANAALWQVDVVCVCVCACMCV